MRESGERKVRYSMRVKFITERVGKYELHMLEEYSRVYSDMVLFGAEYPDRITNVLGSMINLSKAEEELPEQDEDLANVLNNLPFATVESHDSTSIKFDSGQSIDIAEVDNAYFRSDPNVDLVGSFVTEVAFEKSDEGGEKAGITMTLDTGGDEVKVETCVDQACTEPADVIVTILKDKPGVFIKASPEEFVMPEPESSPEEEPGSAPESPQEEEAVSPQEEAQSPVPVSPQEEAPENQPEEEPVSPQEEAQSPPPVEEFGIPTLTQITSPRVSPGGPQSPRLVIIEDESDAPEISNKAEIQEVQPMENKVEIQEVLPVENHETQPEVVPAEIQETQPSTNACKFLERDLPKPSRNLIVHRFDTDLMRGSLIEYKESILQGLFDAYDVGVFGGELGKAIRGGKLQIEMKFGDETSNLSSADISGNLFTLVLSKPLLMKMTGNRKGKHEIFGMTCETQFEVIMTLVESFCVIVAIELCEMGDHYPEYARKLFGHEGSEQKIAPPDDELRQRIMDLKRDPKAIVKVTLKDGKEYIVAGARSLTEVLLIDGDDRKRVAYSDVTHLDGQPL